MKKEVAEALISLGVTKERAHELMNKEIYATRPIGFNADWSKYEKSKEKKDETG
jgi:hypothetical protein